MPGFMRLSEQLGRGDFPSTSTVAKLDGDFFLSQPLPRSLTRVMSCAAEALLLAAGRR